MLTGAEPSVTRAARWRVVALGAGTVALVGVVCRDGTAGWTAARVVGVLVLSRLVRWAGPPVGLPSGILLAAAGGAIAGPYAAKAGLTVMTVLGAVMVLAGLALAWSAGLDLARRHRGWRRLLLLPAVLVVLQLGAMPLIGAVAATNVPPTDVGSVTPADHGLRFEDVTLRAPDGVRLSAWYVPSTNGAAVVVLHGAGSTRRNVLDHAVVLAEAGFGTLLLDARGHGRSGGDAMDFGWHGADDIRSAVTWLVGRPDVRDGRVAALGLSMGGEQAITAAAEDERIVAVVAEGATVRVAGDSGFLDAGVQTFVRRTVERIMFATADLLTSASPPVTLRSAIARIAPRPVLLIAGSPEDEIPAGRWLREAAPATTEVWELPDTPHTDALARHRDAWTERVLAFLLDATTSR